MGVVVRRYIDFLILFISTLLLLALFFAAASLFLCSFLKYFLFFSICTETEDCGFESYT